MADRVLVVDDEEEILALIEKKLLAEGYAAITAKTGKDALKQITKARPSLILMDILLPDMEGPEVVQQLSEDPATCDIPVIFLSGIVSGEQGESKPTEVNVGGKLYPALPKPFSSEALLSIVRKELA